MTKSIKVNGREYNFPKNPLVVVCVDGSQQEYIHAAIDAGVAPYLKSLMQGKGTYFVGECVVPSFTNPNNLSIVTGVPPKIHGICGNFFYDKELGAEVMMNDPKYLKAPTILAKFADEGLKLAVITAKDKLRKLLGHKMKGICFSSEKADVASVAENGIDNLLTLVGKPLPSVYSADLSEFVFEAGVKIFAKHRPDIMYLSTTDYIQHKAAPGTKQANDFYQMMDGHLAELDKMGANLVITADHGMHAKHNGEGKPNILYLQDLLDDKFGKGATRVILPITDPYVVHHGALGSYGTIYLESKISAKKIKDYIGQHAFVSHVYSKTQAVQKFELDGDRIGDIIVVSRQDAVIGTSVARHDLKALEVPLRSHGGLSEQQVPILTNRVIKSPDKSHRWRNFDAFHLGLNCQ